MVENLLKNLIKNLLAGLFYGPIFQKEPFYRWIVAGIVSPLKIYKKKYKNMVFKYNVSSIEVRRIINLFWLDSNREIATRRWIEQNVKKGDVFLNIGAHIGTYVIFVNKLKKLRKTICIEASSANVAELMINLNINKIENTSIFSCAAGDRDKLVEFTYERLNPGYYNARVLDLHYSKKHKEPKQGSEFIQMKKLDDIFKTEKIHLPNIILMDIDGHELLALRGMKNIIANKSLRWAVIETNKHTQKFVKAFMKKYRFYELQEKIENEPSGPINRIFIKKL